MNYPGSTYDLTYNPQADQLQGTITRQPFNSNLRCTLSGWIDIERE